VDTSLLETKFFIPVNSPGLVTRTGLLKRLQDCTNYRLILVSAPAGFGKTTLLSEWIHQTPPTISTAWISLDERDNEPRWFWDYFITAIKKTDPTVGETSLTLLRSGQQISIESILTSLLNDLTSIFSDFVLMMDDFHFIQSPIINQNLTFFLEHMPPGMHLVISTRADPPLPISRFRGKGTLLEIGADNLRFSREETVSLFVEMGIQPLSDKLIDAMNTKAEGWVAGLKMAALSMRDKEDLDTFIADFTGSQRFITDYLFEEVLEQQLDKVRTFLLQTSILNRLSYPLCDAVCGREDSEDMLSRLDNSNLFIFPLDDSRHWYRYHHLFRDLLLHQLEKGFGDDEIKELHLKASVWFEDNNLLDDAINHALAAINWERAMDLISKPEVQARMAASQAMLNWLEQIPVKEVRSRTQICFNFVYGLIGTGRYDDAETWLTYLDEIAETDTHLQGRIATARSVIAGGRNDYPHLEENARKALSLLHEDDHELGIVSGALAGLYMAQQRFMEAEPLYKRSYESFLKMRYISHAIPLLIRLGFMQIWKGEWNQAVDMLNQAIKFSEGDSIINTQVSFAHLLLGCVQYQRDDLEKAAFHQEKARDSFKFSSTIDNLTPDSIYLHLAITKAAMGDMESALEAMKQADELVDYSYPPKEALNAAFHAFVALNQGDNDSVSRWIDDIIKLEQPISFEVPGSVQHLYDMRKGKITESYLLKEYELRSRQRLNSHVKLIRIRQALISKQLSKSLEFLAEALVLAKQEGNIRGITDFGISLAPLLRRAILNDIEPVYARKLLDIVVEEEHQRKIRQSEILPSSSTPGVLSKRETEILRLIADGLSNQEIAGRLFIALGTAKTHIRHVFDKLGVNDRRRAIAKARDLNLI